MAIVFLVLLILLALALMWWFWPLCCKVVSAAATARLSICLSVCDRHSISVTESNNKSSLRESHVEELKQCRVMLSLVSKSPNCISNCSVSWTEPILAHPCRILVGRFSPARSEGELCRTSVRACLARIPAVTPTTETKA